MVSDVEHHFIGSLAIYTSSFKECLYRLFVLSSMGYLLPCDEVRRSFLYVNLLSNTWFAHIFPILFVVSSLSRLYPLVHLKFTCLLVLWYRSQEITARSVDPGWLSQ